MEDEASSQNRPDIVAATRGGDESVAMEGEGDPATATLEQALFWQKIYAELFEMEEAVLERVRQLQALQSPDAQQEVELTNVPVIASQVERFRSRLGFWEARVKECQQASN